jgi:hypothetical protein
MAWHELDDELSASAPSTHPNRVVSNIHLLSKIDSVTETNSHTPPVVFEMHERR